jgi:RNA methyltransferase, TrmH family
MITSFQNSRIKNVLKLRRQRARKKQGKTIIEGYRSLLRAVDNGYALEDLYVCSSMFLGDNEPALIQRAKDQGVQVFEVSEEPFQKMAYVERPDGLLAVAPQVRQPLSDHPPAATGFYLIVEAIERPGNLGSIMRSADAAGVAGLIICDPQTDIYNPEVIRASVGTIFTVPVLEAATEQAIRWCGEHNLRTLAATPHTDTLYTDSDMTQPLALVVGSEKYGLSQTWIEQSDIPVRIPMFGQADSLNVATATTLLLYEVVRQRGNVASIG